MSKNKVGTINLVPLSGGKDSQATAIIAHNSGTENIRHVFADTGIEHESTYEHQDYLFRNVCKNLIVWQGTRREESRKRRSLTPWEAEIGDIYERTGFLVHRPIVYMTEREVKNLSRRYGVALNPLYAEGFGRVGCFPCKNEVKEGIRLIGQKHPEHIEKIAAFEQLVSQANKAGVSTFFDGRVTANFLNDDNIITSTHGVKTHVAWANSTKRGRIWQQEMHFEQAECVSACFCE